MDKKRFQKTPIHFGQYMALKTLCGLLRLPPYRTAIFLGTSLISLTRFLFPKRLDRMQQDIALAFPKKSPEQVKQIAVESWRNMGRIFAEFIQLSSMNANQFKKHCRIEGIEKLQQAQGTTGGIIHIGHFTNWEAFGLAASAYGFDKAVLAQRVDNPYVDQETNRLRNIFTGHTFYSNHQDRPFFTCIRWLKNKKILGILFDQNTVSGEVWASFLGRTAAFSPITALLAIKAQVPVFPVYVTREPNGQLICHIDNPVWPPKQYSLPNVRSFTRTLIDYYEKWTRQDPAAWLWAHNRWKREREGNEYLALHPEERV